ncbi:MAG: polyprenyl synthetase family protein [Alphaproteobacteria bacterium]|nr:polyprenyl synthetase family protein [Alphaproteobacteria bacterium]
MHPSLKPSLLPSSGFEPLLSLLQNQLSAVNTCLLQKMESPVALIPEVAGYLISLGGKRLRPLLTIASAELCGYKGERHIHLAACVEFIHTATLLHDDVVDESTLRRGRQTANSLWNNKASVLVGDFLFSRAFELMVADGSLEILDILSKASSAISEGEVLQLSMSHSLELTQETYLKIIESKTARLFSAATEVGAVVAKASDEKRKALAQFGQALGIAFQLTDDILDYTANQGQLGKTIGDDFREGKVTLPLLLAYQKGRETSFWEDMLAKETRDDNDLKKALTLLNESNALIESKQMAEIYVEEALACLTKFPPTSLKSALEELAHFSLHREM